MNRLDELKMLCKVAEHIYRPLDFNLYLPAVYFFYILILVFGLDL